MKPCWSGLHQCMVATFQSVVLFFWRKLVNLLRPSITTILQHRTDGCSNGCSSLACTILCIVKSYPLFIFLKCGWNNLNSYNSKTQAVRTNFESPWGFELYEFNCFHETTMTDCTIAIAQEPSFKIQPSGMQYKLEFWGKILSKGHNETWIAPENFVYTAPKHNKKLFFLWLTRIPLTTFNASVIISELSNSVIITAAT